MLGWRNLSKTVARSCGAVAAAQPRILATQPTQPDCIKHDPIWLVSPACCSVVVISISTFSHVRIPLVLGGGAAGLRLATHLRQKTSTRSTWWMPFYHAETNAEVPALMQRISEDEQKSWRNTCCEKKRCRCFCFGCLECSQKSLLLLLSSHKP